MKPFKHIFLIAVSVADMIIVLASLYAAVQIRGSESVHGQVWNIEMAAIEFIVFLCISLFVVALLFSNGLYRLRVMRLLSDQIMCIIKALSYTLAALSILGFYDHSPWVIDSRLAILYFTLISIISLIVFHIAVVYPLYSFLVRKNIFSRKAIIIGDGPIAEKIIAKSEQQQYQDIIVVGAVADPSGVTKERENILPTLGTYSELPSIISSRQIDEAIIAISSSAHEEILNVIDICRTTPVTIVLATPFMEMIYDKINIQYYAEVPVVVLRDLSWNRFLVILKRQMDIILACIAIVIFAVPMAVISMLVRVTSKGPIIYRQIRIGKDGREFIMYKFRTMIHIEESSIDVDYIETVDALPILVGSEKIVAATLLTPIGRYLRKTSLDELPQLLNVVQGEMSLVGPRPALVKEYNKYERWHKRRLSVLPGCTGLWQVSSRSEGNFFHMVLLDLYYINNVTLAFDLLLILKTIPIMIFGRGGR